MVDEAYFFAVVVGPAILLGVIVWIWARNRKTSRALDARSERGARELREDMTREREQRES